MAKKCEHKNREGLGLVMSVDKCLDCGTIIYVEK